MLLQVENHSGEQVKLKKWALIAEISGAVGITISLIFVATEVQQNTRSQNAALYQVMSAELREITASVPNEIRLKLQAGEELSELERVQYYQWLGSTMRTYESWWKQHEIGTIDDDTFESYISHMGISLAEESIRNYWLNDKPYRALSGFEAFVSEYFDEAFSTQ